MTDKFLSVAIQREVQKMFEQNQDTIVSYLVEGDPDINRLVIRSTLLSAQMSAQFIIRLLESAGIIESAPDSIAFAQMINDEMDSHG